MLCCFTGVQYDGDALFLEEDAVLSPDAFRVLWFSLRVKNSFGPNIFQVSLGGYAGENVVNAHPNTVVVRKAVFLQPMAYAFNGSFFALLSKHYDRIFVGNVADFSEAIAYALAAKELGLSYHMVVPTLSRMWHVGSVGLGHGGDYSRKRDTDAKPWWADYPTFMDLDKAVVNRGIRDVFGVFCVKSERLSVATFTENVCKGSANRFPLKDRRRMVCLKQDYVQDPCVQGG